MRKRNISILLLGAILVLALALGVSAVFAQADQDPDTPPDVEETEPFHHWDRGFPGFGRGPGTHLEGLTPLDELIATELGVTVDQLRDAMTSALQSAREDGVLGFHRGPGFDKDGEIESYLSDALGEIGVTLDAFEAAEEAATALMLEQLVEEGVLTEEQLSLIEARNALKDVIDHGDIMSKAAESLGIELLDPEDALEQGVAPWSLMEQLQEQNLTMEDLMEAAQAAYEEAINQAVADGTIDEEQAEMLLSDGFGLGFGIMKGPGGMRGFGHGPGFGMHRGFGGSHNCDEMGQFGGMRGFPGHGFDGFGPDESQQAPTGSNL